MADKRCRRTATDINADHNLMPPSWTSANDAGPLASTRAPNGPPTLHLESGCMSSPDGQVSEMAESDGKQLAVGWGAASWSRSAVRPIVNRSSERPPAAGSSDKNREAFAQLRVKADE